MTTKKPTPKPTPDERKPRKDIPMPSGPSADRAVTIETSAAGLGAIALSPVASACTCCGNVRTPPCPTCGN